MTALLTLSRKLGLVTLMASSAALAAACGSSVDGGNGGSTQTSTGGGGSTATTVTAACPAAMPAEGAACAAEASECHYPVNCCADTVASCSGGHWSVVPGPCIGGTEICPEAPPADGEACVSGCVLTTCSWGTCPGSGPSSPAVTATCVGDQWEVTAACDLPGIGEHCGQSAGGAECGPGLACCYPCGIPNCNWTCTTPCAPSDPGCNDGCMLYP